MQRILDPERIEAFAQSAILRIRLPDTTTLFARRAQRLRASAERHAVGDYLRLMADVADNQQLAVTGLTASLVSERFAGQLGKQIELAHEHKMPLLQAVGWPRQPRWRTLLNELCKSMSR
ncbi:MAG: formate dehydrogenase accessory protein FdhE, partial [Sinobacteraceae bacterium]|nr:formate dehydrogenase accessory protein FdhE [Nevskiaceae bacterium]